MLFENIGNKNSRSALAMHLHRRVIGLRASAITSAKADSIGRSKASGSGGYRRSCRYKTWLSSSACPTCPVQRIGFVELKSPASSSSSCFFFCTSATCRA